MSSVHKAIRDLVEKRLWPVALLMVVALVAIPVIGGRGGDPAAGAGEDALPIAPTDAVSTKQVLDLVGPPSVRKRAGAPVDPFRRPVKAKELSTSPTSTDASSGGSGAAGASGGQDGAATAGTPASPTSNPTNGDKSSEPTGDKSSEPTGGKVRPSAYDLSKVADVRFGKLGGTLKRSRSLAAASTLPSEKDPIVMLAGALKETDEVRFLIVAGSGETSGDGECKLKDARCVSVDMRIGERQLFRVKGEEYELQLVSINSVRRAKSTSRTRVRFGAAGAGERSISRLEPLVGAADPALLYLPASGRCSCSGPTPRRRATGTAWTDPHVASSACARAKPPMCASQAAAMASTCRRSPARRRPRTRSPATAARRCARCSAMQQPPARWAASATRSTVPSSCARSRAGLPP